MQRLIGGFGIPFDRSLFSTTKATLQQLEAAGAKPENVFVAITQW